MAGRVIVVREGGLVTASSKADAVEHKHANQQRGFVPEAVGDHWMKCV